MSLLAALAALVVAPAGFEPQEPSARPGARAGSAPEDPPLGELAIVGVDVIPMAEDGSALVQRDHTVVVSGGRIARIGPADETPVPAGAARIAGQGRFLIPGLFDTHLHLLCDERIADEHAAAELALLVANGVTSARIMIGRPLHLELRRRIEAGELAGPHLSVASPQLAGRSFGRAFHGRAVTTPAEARDAVRDFAGAGYDAIKLTFWIQRPVYDAAIATAAELGIPVVGHVGPAVGLERALEAGQQIEHLDQVLEALLPWNVEAGDAGRVGLSGIGIWRTESWEEAGRYDAERIPAVARRIAEAGVPISPTENFLVSSFGTGRTDEDVASCPEASFVSDEVRADLLSGRARFWSDPPPVESRERFVELRRALIRALSEAGAPLMTGSDAPEWMLLPGFSLHQELQSLVAAGLEPHAALRAATRTPAGFLGTLAERGSIEEGKEADLVLLGANPLEDVSRTRAIEGVVLHGRWLPRERLDELLEAARTELSAAPLRQW